MGTVYIGGKSYHLNPDNPFASGGEADIFEYEPGKLAKLWKPPNHPLLRDSPLDRALAAERLTEQQVKLPALMSLAPSLPDRVVTPILPVVDKSGKKILGYSMHKLTQAEVLYRYGDPEYREEQGIEANSVVEILLSLHTIVKAVHGAKVVIGDFNSLNVLIKEKMAYLIDTDSMQFLNFICRAFTDKFVDPLLCDPQKTSPVLIRPHNPNSDWYAFLVMAMQCLLYIGPYDGVYLPKDPQLKIPHSARPLKRKSIFDAATRKPKSALPLEHLPDGLIHFMQQVIEKDERGEFPVHLLHFRWTKCVKCGTEHARGHCPHCQLTAPAALKQRTEVRGRVKATELFITRSGIILTATVQDGQLRYLFHEGDRYLRENHRVVKLSALDPSNPHRYRIAGPHSLFGDSRGNLEIIDSGGGVERVPVDRFGSLPVFDTNAKHHYWLQYGSLVKEGRFGTSQFIGRVLANQTRFWAGRDFGFGFYQASGGTIAFVFDAEQVGINDGIVLPPILGQIIDTTAVFGRDRCWFFVSALERGKMINRCFLIRFNGKVVATEEVDANEPSWLGGSIRGKCAFDRFLFVPTDEGIIQIESDQNGKLFESAKYPDTAPWVTANSSIIPGANGLCIVSRKSITELVISS